MKYAYFFYVGSIDTIASTFEQDEPLPHLEVGHKLVLTADYNGDLDAHVEILEIQLVISHLGGALVRFDVHVVCREVDKPPLL